MSQAASINLSALDDADGFQISGTYPAHGVGLSVASAGDFNGDGFDDFIVGAYAYDGGYPGASYVVFGRPSGFGAGFSVDQLDGSNGFAIPGLDEAATLTGFSVASAGDLNGDGFDDLVIGSKQEGGESVYVVFGRAEPLGATLDLASLDGSNGFRLIDDFSNGMFGHAVASAGDVNGDGLDDLVIGNPANWFNAGMSFVLFGKREPFEATVLVGALVGDHVSAPDVPVTMWNAFDGSQGFVILGESRWDYSGIAVSSAGDINGDGLDDVIIGAPNADSSGLLTGGAYVVFGSVGGHDGLLHLASLDGTNGLKLVGPGDWRNGVSVASAGDVNGDGYADLVVGAPDNDEGETDAGAAYVVFGGAALAPEIVLDELDGVNGFKLFANQRFGYAGVWVDSAGDFNGDGFDDLLVGAYRGDGAEQNSGVTYLVFGGAGERTPRLSLADLDGVNGFRIEGADAGDESGRRVAGAGDINGDGFDDLIIGAVYAAPNGYSSGAAYVLYGKGPDAAVHRSGSAAGQTIRGGAFDDSLGGAAGDDLLDARAGDDRLIGGRGADTLLGGAGADRLEGRGGADVVRGGRGEDVLVAFGGDRLFGGGGADTFIIREGGGGSGRIQDFSAAAGDRIDLSAIDAIVGGADDAFTWVDAFSGATGELMLVAREHVTVVRGDIDGDGVADVSVTIRGEAGAADFVL